MQWPGYWEKDYEITFAKIANIISRYEKIHILYHSKQIYADAQKALRDIGADPENKNIYLVHQYGMFYDEITASSLIEVDNNGKPLDPKSPWLNDGCLNLCKWIFNTREDVNYYVHGHSENVMAVGGTEEGLERVSPEWRGALDATGRPTATVMADAAEAFAKDKELSDAPTTFRIEIGSKRIPEVEIAGGELCYHNKMTQGVEALREGFSSPASFTIGKRIYSLNLEKYMAGRSHIQTYQNK